MVGRRSSERDTTQRARCRETPLPGSMQSRKVRQVEHQGSTIKRPKEPHISSCDHEPLLFSHRGENISVKKLPEECSRGERCRVGWKEAVASKGQGLLCGCAIHVWHKGAYQSRQEVGVTLESLVRAPSSRPSAHPAVSLFLLRLSRGPLLSNVHRRSHMPVVSLSRSPCHAPLSRVSIYKRGI